MQDFTLQISLRPNKSELKKSLWTVSSQ